MRSIAVGAICGVVAIACGSTLDEAELRAANDQSFRLRAGQGAAAPGAAEDGVAVGSDVGVGSGVGGDDTAGAAGPRGAAGPDGQPAQEGSADGTQQEASSGATKSEIRLGSIGVQSGVLGAAMQTVVQAARAWVADVNARGGLNGHPVRLISIDDGGDPARAQAAARRLVEQERVIALFATHMPTTESAITSYMTQKQVPTVGTCTCATDADDSQMVFQIGASNRNGLTWEFLLGVLAGTDKRKVSVFYCREANTCTVLNNGFQKYAKSTDIEIVHTAQVSIAQPDFTSEVIAARSAGAEVIVTLVDGPTTVRIAQSAHRQNYNPVIVGNQGGNEEPSLKVKDLDGSIVSATVAQWSGPLMADYREAMARYVPGGRLGDNGARQWVAGKLLELLAKNWGDTVTSQDVLNGLYALRGETLGGRMPPTTYQRGKAPTLDQLCTLPVKIEGGKFVELNGGRFMCPPPH